VQALLEVNASVDDEDHEGNTVLHFATSADVVELLIMAGADVDHENMEGKTPGRLALDHRNTAVVEALINGRADPSKIYGPREGKESSRFLTAGDLSKEAETGSQCDYIRGVLDLSTKHEQEPSVRMPAPAKCFPNVDTHLPMRSRNHSSVPTPGGHSREQTALKPHTSRPGRDAMDKQDFTRRESSDFALEPCDQLWTADSTDVGTSSQGHRLVIGIVSIAYESAIMQFAHDPSQNFPSTLPLDATAVYAIGQHGKPPEADVKPQQDEYQVTKSSFPPHKDLVRHMVYDELAAQGRDNRAWLGDNDFDRAGKTANAVLSNYIEALVVHIAAEVASQCSGPPLGRFCEELVMLVPTTWPHSLKTMILHVSFSLFLFRFCHNNFDGHGLNIQLLGCESRQYSGGRLGHSIGRRCLERVALQMDQFCGADP
jgi:hypothetical protein